jgi:hypothetical protein
MRAEMEHMEHVEIKVSFGAEHLAEAASAFGLRAADAEERDIWFCEYLDGPAGPTGLPLLDQGIILRLRRRRGRADDATMKIRRSEQAPLPGDWRPRLGEQETFGVEGDWVGSRRLVSASLVARLGDDDIDEVATGRRSVARVFSAAQEDLLRVSCPLPIDLRALEPLGPVAAHKWEPAPRGFEHPIAAERWKVDELRFLELSIRVPGAAAETAQAAFERHLRDRGLDVDTVQETKTRLVLGHLARAAAGRARRDR